MVMMASSAWVGLSSPRATPPATILQRLRRHEAATNQAERQQLRQSRRYNHPSREREFLSLIPNAHFLSPGAWSRPLRGMSTGCTALGSPGNVAQADDSGSQ